MSDYWAVGLVRGSWSLGQSPCHWLEAPVGRYYADPFLLETGCGLYLFVEDYDLAGDCAHLTCLQLDPHNGQVIAHGPALHEAFHLSYPFVFEFEGQRYLMPEAHQSGQLRLYRWEGSDNLLHGQWNLHRILLEQPVVDPTLVCRAGFWYLLVGSVGESARHQCQLYWSNSPLGPFQLHPDSPVVQPWTGRNAGRIFQHQDRLLRPCQNRQQTYGGSLTIFEILELTPDSFQSQCYGQYSPQSHWPYPHGLHHLDSVGDWTVIDAKRIQ